MSHFDTLTRADTLIFSQAPGLKPTNNDIGG